MKETTNVIVSFLLSPFLKMIHEKIAMKSGPIFETNATYTSGRYFTDVYMQASIIRP